MDLFSEFIAWVGTEEGERAANVILAILAALAAGALWVFGVFGKLWKALFGKPDEKDKETAPTYQIRDKAKGGFADAETGGIAIGQVMGNQTIYQGAPVFPSGDMLSMDQHLTILEKPEASLTEKLSSAHAEDRELLSRQIAELQAQIANPEKSLAEAQKRIADLEALLEREGNGIAPDRIAEARAALEAGDFSLADDLFAEIEARAEMEVQRAARAAYGRGEVAEQEVRWHDAYAHCKRAAARHETVDHLTAYARMTWKLAKGDEAVVVNKRLVDLAKTDHGPESAEYAKQINNLAVVLQAQGRYAEAEALYGQALEIGRATLGEAHPDYATHLNNLAGVVEDQGRYAEAEALYRQALEITQATLGEDHPAYATRLNNLAGAVQAQGRFAEAEALYEQALEIDRATLGEDHPDYAIDLGNLGQLLGEQGKIDDARAMLQKAMAIFEAALPSDHPHIAETQRRMDALPSENE